MTQQDLSDKQREEGVKIQLREGVNMSWTSVESHLDMLRSQGKL